MTYQLLRQKTIDKVRFLGQSKTPTTDKPLDQVFLLVFRDQVSTVHVDRRLCTQAWPLTPGSYAFTAGW